MKVRFTKWLYPIYVYHANDVFTKAGNISPFFFLAVPGSDINFGHPISRMEFMVGRSAVTDTVPSRDELIKNYRGHVKLFLKLDGSYSDTLVYVPTFSQYYSADQIMPNRSLRQ